MKKLILLLFILPIFCFAQTNVTPQWKKFPVFDSLGYSITGSTGNHWLYDAHFIRVNYLTKSGFTDSLNAHKVYFTNNFQKIGDTVDLANSVSITGTMTANSGMLIGGVTDTAGYSFSENRLINGVLVREGFGSTKFQGGGAAMATFYGTSQSHALAVPALMSTPFFSSDSSRTWHRIPVIDNYVGATLDTVTHTLTVTGSGGVPNALTNGWGINTFSFDGSSAGVQVKADTSSGKLATQYYASTVVGADGILTGLVTTTVTTTATTTAGTYRLNNALIVKSTSTNTTIPAQDATLNRYTLIVGDASGVFTAVNGTLAADAVEPDIPANKALIASIYIPTVGGTTTTTGGGTGKGTVTKVISSTTDILVANPTTTPILTLNKVNGFPITYYDPTSSIQTQLNGKQATLTLTTTGTSGAATLTGATLNIPQYSGATAGNPTGLLTFTAVNGTATTFKRADGLNAIDSTVVASYANHPTLAQLQTKVNNYVLSSALLNLVPGYGLSGSNYNTSISRTWTADTTSTTGLVSKLRLATNLDGYVQSVSVASANGLSGTSSGGQTPALTLTLNTIKPNVVAQTPAGTAGTDSVMVKHSDGTIKAISPTYYGTGGGGSPGGSNTQLQYNNSGAFGGISGATTDGTTVTLTTPVLTGLPTGSGVTSSATASTLAARDANGNSKINNVIENYQTIATAAGTTTLTVSSPYQTFFTGSTTQIVVLPVTSTLVLGMQFSITNLSSGNVTVNSSGGNFVATVAPSTNTVLTCILTSGTSAASWSTPGAGVYLPLGGGSMTGQISSSFSTALSSDNGLGGGSSKRAFIGYNPAGTGVPSAYFNSGSNFAHYRYEEIIFGNGTNQITVSPPGTYSANRAVTFPDDNGTIALTKNITSVWGEVTGGSQILTPGTSWVATGTGGLYTFVLPTTCAVGQVIGVAGSGAGGWKITQNAGQNLIFNATSSTAGITGYVASANRYDAVTFVCTVANTTWVCISHEGTLTVF